MNFPKHTLAYLATPYTRFKPDIAAAFAQACKISARLIRAGLNVYSPIVHQHMVAAFGNLDPLDHSLWLPLDEVMMARTDVLIVAHMKGWDESKGIAHEIAFFERAKKPIYDLDPITLAMKRRARVAA